MSENPLVELEENEELIQDSKSLQTIQQHELSNVINDYLKEYIVENSYRFQDDLVMRVANITDFVKFIENRE